MNTQHKRTILAMDDDEINLMILVKGAEAEGYNVKPFTDGEVAWDYLERHPGTVDIALLDKMMPGLSGLDLLRRIKNSPAHKHMPVILQTGDVGIGQMREGLESGAHYYLTKPFHPEILAGLIHSASNECSIREEMLARTTAAHNRFIGMMEEGSFIIRTHEEAMVLASAISHAATHPEFVALGLMELLANAIEHGNLGIGYDRKRHYLVEGNWPEKLAEHIADAAGKKHVVHVRMEKMPTGLHLIIRDEGKGFDWRDYINDEDNTQLSAPNGRGIAKAMIMLDDVRYVGNGNEVHCNIGMPSYFSLVKPQHLPAAHS